ncbi:hypothetical protein PYCCODRAFT_43414 [Trametes coccinea BRFM310]|uniref:Uncharacterized protein n=1 Tax=Trametes coccinea (strain BRFM310) TaxID=1353009 RepID=A0A1Y2J5I7_TRAC3|nr:hypothetical protein PYCCODRAFT_43414 [Trametes coccinea BRFM310]
MSPSPADLSATPPCDPDKTAVLVALDRLSRAVHPIIAADTRAPKFISPLLSSCSRLQPCRLLIRSSRQLCSCPPSLVQLLTLAVHSPCLLALGWIHKQPRLFCSPA